MLLPDTGLDGAVAVAENIRWAVLNLDASHPTSLSGTVSVSIGVASVVPVLTQSGQELTAAADAALYSAKKEESRSHGLRAQAPEPCGLAGLCRVHVAPAQLSDAVLTRMPSSTMRIFFRVARQIYFTTFSAGGFA